MGSVVTNAHLSKVITTGGAGLSWTLTFQGETVQNTLFPLGYSSVEAEAKGGS